jgi:hypothetical protein
MTKQELIDKIQETGHHYEDMKALMHTTSHIPQKSVIKIIDTMQFVLASIQDEIKEWPEPITNVPTHQQ